MSPDENNPLEIPEESASTAVFYQQYNEATIGKSEDTVSEPIQDSDFNDPSVCSTHAHCFFIDLGGMGHLNIVTHFLWKLIKLSIIL